MAAPIEGNKVLIEESDWVTYVGIAAYHDLTQPITDDSKGYVSEEDTEKEIWQIRKIEESDWVTEISYPNGDTGNNYSWDARASLTYK
jgi:hypothetical protein